MLAAATAGAAGGCNAQPLLMMRVGMGLAAAFAAMCAAFAAPALPWDPLWGGDASELSFEEGSGGFGFENSGSGSGSDDGGGTQPELWQTLLCLYTSVFSQSLVMPAAMAVFMQPLKASSIAQLFHAASAHPAPLFPPFFR